MSTPLDPGLPSDKLVSPVNAPRGTPTPVGVQPGVTGNIILAQYVVVFGTSGGIFIYTGSPGPGNPPLYSFGNVVQDPYGNPVKPGIWAGQPGAIQVGIQAQGGVAELFFVPAGSYASDATAGMLQVSGQAILELVGAQTTATGQPTSDRVALLLWDHGAGATALLQAAYFYTDGSFLNLFDGNYAGLSIPCLSATALHPGTGTGPGVQAVAETWQTGTPLLNSWAASSGVGGLFYRLLPTGHVEIIADIVNAAATGNSICFTLPAGYRVSGTQNHPAGWNNPVVNNSASPPWVTLTNTGAVQVTGIEVANKEIFFHVIAPLGAL